jgi:hypothetical protein
MRDELGIYYTHYGTDTVSASGKCAEATIRSIQDIVKNYGLSKFRWVYTYVSGGAVSYRYECDASEHAMIERMFSNVDDVFGKNEPVNENGLVARIKKVLKCLRLF